MLFKTKLLALLVPKLLIDVTEPANVIREITSRKLQLMFSLKREHSWRGSTWKLLERLLHSLATVYLKYEMKQHCLMEVLNVD